MRSDHATARQRWLEHHRRPPRGNLPGVGATGLTPRPSRQVQVHVDGAGATNAPVSSSPIGRLFYSIKFTLPDSAPQIYDAIPDAAWARHITGQSWDETDITEIIELLYPPG